MHLPRLPVPLAALAPRVPSDAWTLSHRQLYPWVTPRGQRSCLCARGEDSRDASSRAVLTSGPIHPSPPPTTTSRAWRSQLRGQLPSARSCLLDPRAKADPWDLTNAPPRALPGPRLPDASHDQPRASVPDCCQTAAARAAISQAAGGHIFQSLKPPRPFPGGRLRGTNRAALPRESRQLMDPWISLWASVIWSQAGGRGAGDPPLLFWGEIAWIWPREQPLERHLASAPKSAAGARGETSLVSG